MRFGLRLSLSGSDARALLHAALLEAKQTYVADALEHSELSESATELVVTTPKLYSLNFKGGDFTAIVHSLVQEHQAGVRAFIRALGVDEAWVDDVAQETFLIAYRKLDHWDRTREAGPWLRGIARRLALNERRKAARRSSGF